MRKLINPQPGGGFPLTNADVLSLQDTIYTTIQTFMGSVSGAWIVSGLDVSQVNINAKTLKISSGYVFLEGELRYFPGYTGGYPAYVVAASDTYETRRYGNGAVQNAYVTKSAMTTTVQPTVLLGRGESALNSGGGGGTDVSFNYITFNPQNASQRLIPIITAKATADLAKEVTDRTAADTALQAAITNEETARTAADTNLQNAINTLTALVNTKQTRVTTRIPWTDIPLTNPAYTSTENVNDTTGQPYHRAQYMRTEDGIVHLRGYIRSFVSPGGSISNQLPSTILPAKAVQFRIPYFNYLQSTICSCIHIVNIDSTNGMVHDSQRATFGSTSIPPTSSLQPWFLLDGICYSVEG